MICVDVGGGGGGGEDWGTDEIGLGSPRDVGGDVRMSPVMMHRRRMSVSVPPWHDMFPSMLQGMGG